MKLLSKIILALDPGNHFTGYAVIRLPDFKLIEFGKVENDLLIEDLFELGLSADAVAIEKIASYGMPVGADVFDTCIWIGQFYRELHAHFPDKTIDYIFRKEEKISLCGSLKAKDTNIRQALINRYAKHDFKAGKGTKANPDTFHGVSADAWQAIAVGVTWWEVYGGGALSAPVSE